MPRRNTPLVNGEIYHVFNRGVNKQPISHETREYQRAVDTFTYYSHDKVPLRYSKFIRTPLEERVRLENIVGKSKKLVDVLSYCLMPNHYHFLVKQNSTKGITNFIRNFQISYSRYFNTRNNRVGPLFQGQFKVVRIEDDNQLLHVSRYVHLNPYTSYIVPEQTSLITYPWSSLPEYLGISNYAICQKELIMALIPDKTKHQEFVLNQADYQRNLESIRHLTLE